MLILSLCFLTGLINYKYFKVSENIFLTYIVITFFVECLAYYSLNLSPQRRVNHLLYSFYVPTQFLIISLYFYTLLQSKIIKKVLSSLVILLVCIYVPVAISGFSYYRIFVITNIIISIYSIIFLKQLLNIEDEFFSNPNFWIVTGILFFNAGGFFLSSFVTFLSQKNLELARKLFSINHLLNIIYYSLVTYGFICQRRLARS